MSYFSRPYFAAAFFSAPYFGFSTLVQAKPPIMRDDIVVSDIGTRLRATGFFPTVKVGCTPKNEPISAQDLPACWVDRTTWGEADKVDPYSPVRTGQFTVWLRVSEVDPEDRMHVLAQLESEVINAIEGQQLGGFCFPAQSKIVRGGDTAGVPPPQREVTLNGQFAYAPTVGYGQRDTTPVTLY